MSLASIGIELSLQYQPRFRIHFVVGEYYFSTDAFASLPTLGMVLDFSTLLSIDELVQIKDYDLREDIETELYEVVGIVAQKDERGIVYVISCHIYECKCPNCNNGDIGNFPLN